MYLFRAVQGIKHREGNLPIQILDNLTFTSTGLL